MSGLAPFGDVYELRRVLVAGDVGCRARRADCRPPPPPQRRAHGGCAAGDKGRHSAKCRLLVSDVAVSTLGGRGAAGCMRRQLAQKHCDGQVDDEVHEVGGIGEVERMRRGEIEPVEGEHARHSDRDRVCNAREPRDRDQRKETDNAEERRDDVEWMPATTTAASTKVPAPVMECQHDLRAEQKPRGPHPCGHEIRLRPPFPTGLLASSARPEPTPRLRTSVVFIVFGF